MAEAAFVWSLAALPEVVRAGRFPLDDRDFAYAYRSPTHALHLYDYHGTVRIGEAVHGLRPGDLTISPAGVETRYHLPRPGHHWCIHFRPAAGVGGTCAIPLHLPLGPLKPRAVDAIARISGLMAVPADGARLARAAAAAALQELLLTLAGHAAARPARERAGRAADAVARAASELEARLGEQLSVPDLSRRVGLSQNWLARAFRARYGQTLQRYLLVRRVEHAQLLLRTTDLPVARIAERLGFGDAQHFNKQFRRLAGCNPTAYRLRGASGG